MADHLVRLFDHLAWSDTVVLDALERAAPPPERELRWYAHVLGTEHVWLTRIRQETSQVAVWPELALTECRPLAAKNHREFTELLVGLTPARLDQGIPYRNSAGQAFTTRLEDILLHICLHGCYHRGQIAAAMRDRGATPAPTDYIGFVRGVPAATTRL